MANSAPKCRRPRTTPGVCRFCRCTDADCSECVELTGEPCHWIAADVCSACATPELRRERKELRAMLRAMDGHALPRPNKRPVTRTRRANRGHNPRAAHRP